MKIHEINDKITVIIDDFNIEVHLEDQAYVARYPFRMEDVSRSLVEAMVYVLFYGLEDIPVPEKSKRKGKNTLLSFSGGVDSYAAMMLMPSAFPVYLNRLYAPEYGKSQQDIVKATGSFVIDNDMELIRRNYRFPGGRQKSHGFNWGFGYAALIIPMMDIMNADTIAFGTPVYTGGVYKYAGKDEVMEALEVLGINIISPVCGITEVLTAKIASMGELSGIVSSCHYTDKKSCMSCFKCFRKQLSMGNRAEFPQNVITKVSDSIENKTLGIPSAYGMMKCGLLDADLDMSFAERYDDRMLKENLPPHLAEFFAMKYESFGIKKMTKKDHSLINKFYKTIKSW